MNMTIIGADVIVDGEKLPPVPNNKRHCNVTTINGRIFANGYEWKNGCWKMTPMALWHLWF